MTKKYVYCFSDFDEAVEATSPLNRSKSDVHAYLQLDYLKYYLGQLGAKTIVLEEEYTDKDYMLDYVSYYASCHVSYKKTTSRVSFFSSEFSQEYFSEILERGGNDEIKTLQEKFLGFCVLKPLPKTRVGRTCLKPLEKISNTESCIERLYSISLFGIPLSVKTIAFQEQDQEVSACSTAAIWYMLHASVHRVTEQQISSPYEITQQAISVSADISTIKNQEAGPYRHFPTIGLDLRQLVGFFQKDDAYDCLAYGVNEKSCKGDVALIRKGNAWLTNELVCSFFASRHPVMLVGQLYVENKQGKLVLMGMHAVVVLGLKMSPVPLEEPASLQEERASAKISQHTWRCERVSDLYMHDDGIGPFSQYTWTYLSSKKENDNNHASEKNTTALAARESMEAIINAIKHGDKVNKQSSIDEKNSHVSEDNPIDGWVLNCTYKPSYDFGSRVFQPIYAIIPVREKIRINHQPIMEYIDVLMEYVFSMPDHGMACEYFHLLKNGEWGIELVAVQSLKQHLLTTACLEEDERKLWLQHSLPRYMWSATYFLNANGNYVENTSILFDATDITQSSSCPGIISYTSNEKRVHKNIYGQLQRLMSIAVKGLNRKYLSEWYGNPKLDIHRALERYFDACAKPGQGCTA